MMFSFLVARVRAVNREKRSLSAFIGVHFVVNECQFRLPIDSAEPTPGSI